MNSEQIGALIAAGLTAIGVIAAAIRWSVGRMTKSWDGQTEALIKLGESQIESAAKYAELSATTMQGMSALQHGMSQILTFLITGQRPERPSTTGGFKTIDEESGEHVVDRPGAERRRQARTPLQIPRTRFPQHNDDNDT